MKSCVIFGEKLPLWVSAYCASAVRLREVARLSFDAACRPFTQRSSGPEMEADWPGTAAIRRAAVSNMRSLSAVTSREASGGSCSGRIVVNAHVHPRTRGSSDRHRSCARYEARQVSIRPISGRSSAVLLPTFRALVSVNVALRVPPNSRFPACMASAGHAERPLFRRLTRCRHSSRDERPSGGSGVRPQAGF